MIRELFDNIRDTLSNNEKTGIRYNIAKNTEICDYYINKTKLNKMRKAKLNDAIDALNEIYAYLLDKNAKKRNNDDILYALSKLFDDNEYYVRNKISDIKALLNNICDTLSRDEINDIRRNIDENVKLYDAYSSKKGLNKKQRMLFNNAIDNLNKLHVYLLNKNKDLSNYHHTSYHLEKLYEHSEYYVPTLVRQSFNGNYAKYVSNGDNTSSIEEYLNKIRFYLHNLINYYKQKGELKV